jgi:hypothetical protein
MKRIFWMQILFVGAALAQQGTNSLFDDAEIKTYTPKSLAIQGEVANPGLVDLSQLPLQSIPIKELALENGKQVFRGAFFVTGYSLYDILNRVQVKKAPDNSFGPLVDLYVIVENDQGEKAVLSWGEIYYTTDKSNIIIAKSIQGINPAHNNTRWPLPAEPHLICGNDLSNARFLSNPTKITVKSFRGQFAGEKPKDLYASEIKIVAETASASIGDIPSSVASRKYSGISYGHGSGFKGVLNISGFPLKDLIASQITPDRYSEAIVVASAKDGYRSVFSAGEIMNRNDNQDFLLIDKKDSKADGRYTLFLPGDFFADRDVKAVEKLEIVTVK